MKKKLLVSLSLSVSLTLMLLGMFLAVFESIQLWMILVSAGFFLLFFTIARLLTECD